MLWTMADEKPRPATAAAADAAEPTPKERDLVYVYGRSDDGMHVVRSRTGRIEMGELRELEEGRPIQGEVVKLTPTKEHERLFDAETLLPAAEEHREGPGPAQVATDAYRSGWDRVFGEKKRRDLN
jgi:hypothetical protein